MRDLVEDGTRMSIIRGTVKIKRDLTLNRMMKVEPILNLNRCHKVIKRSLTRASARFELAIFCYIGALSSNEMSYY